MGRIKAQEPDHQELALQTLSWISLAQRPLTVEEIQHALAIEEATTALDLDNISDIEDIVSVCAGLVVVDEKSQIVRLVHFTTQEFFERNLPEWLPEAELLIAKACITYLSFDVFGSGPILREKPWPKNNSVKVSDRLNARQRQWALYRYAARYWAHYARQLLPDFTEQLLPFLLDASKVSASHRFVESRKVAGYTGLHLVAYYGLTPMIGPLIERGLRTDERDPNGDTPLLIAARQGQEATVTSLLESDPTCIHLPSKFGETALHHAAHSTNAAVVGVLLRSGLFSVRAENSVGKTALHHAAESGSEEIVEMLIADEERNRLNDGSVLVNISDSNGRTALHHAAARGGEAVVSVLLRQPGIGINTRDDSGISPLDSAIFYGHTSVVSLMLQNPDIDVNTEKKNGWTALMWAAYLKSEDIVKLLLESGRVNDLNTLNKHGETALDLAEHHGHSRVTELLTAHGARHGPKWKVRYPGASE
jgi:ankyrin repeat protein